MLEQLKAYLDQSTTPEISGLVIETVQALSDAGVDEHLFMLRNQMDFAEANDFDSVYEGIVGVLQQFVAGRLAEFGVKIEPTSPLRVSSSLFRAIQLIEVWDDKAVINGLTDAVEGPEAALADIAEQIGELTSAEYLMILEEVSPDLLDRIEELTTEVPVAEVFVGAEHAAERIRKVREKLKAPIFEAALANDDLRLGLAPLTLLAPYLPKLHDLEPEVIGHELFAFAIASGTPDDELSNVLDIFKETLDVHMTALMAVDVAINKLQGELRV